MINIFKIPTPKELATKELAESERSLLQAQSAQSYAECLVRHHTTIINRLRNYLEKLP